MPRQKHQLRQSTLPWGPAPGRAPDGQAVLKTATLDDVQQFDAVFTVAQVRRLQALRFSPHLVGIARQVAFARFQGWDSVRVDHRFTLRLKDSAWPVKEVR